MKTKIILIAIGVVLIIAGLFFLWRAAHPPRKIVIVQKRAVVKEAAKKKALPAIQKKFSNPRVAIVIDDFGYNMNNVDGLLAVKKPVTFSILPHLPYSRRVADLAHSKGYEVILHQPIEAIDKSAPAEADTIKTSMNEEEVISILEKDMASVPGLRGVSNHQGSKGTEDKKLMAVIIGELKKKKLYYFDSLVTYRSVCRDVAKSLGVPYAKRDMFLDNSTAPEYIEKQVLGLRRFAFRKGSAIAVCHDRKNTIAVLARMMPELADEGMVFVSLSEMVK
ncbi:MAG: divergent polysaccharide deacetylase family protein [Candidatus Omnitrophica bacterium]|nr:divergent polysaccharide deacetylase family protein [Candidatus Omnitrophota bacterium]